MPKIADIQETPNPNAVKFILKEPVSHGTSHSFKDVAAANVVAEDEVGVPVIIEIGRAADAEFFGLRLTP